MAKVFPQLAAATAWLRDDGAGLIAGSVHTPQAALGAKHYVFERSDGVTFFDGLIADPASRVALEDAGQVESQWDSLADSCEGGFVAVRVCFDKPSLAICNDPLGLQQVFYQRVGRAWLISNHAGLLSRISGAKEFDCLGASSMILMGWPAGDRTLVSDVRVMPGGQVWEWHAGASEPRARAHFNRSASGGAGTQRLKPPQVRETMNTMGAFCRAVADSKGVLDCGLTGGRDSRLLALICAEHDVAVEHITYAPEESVDARIARRVATTLGLNHRIDWDSSTRLEDLWGTDRSRLH